MTRPHLKPRKHPARKVCHQLRVFDSHINPNHLPRRTTTDPITVRQSDLQRTRLSPELLAASCGGASSTSRPSLKHAPATNISLPSFIQHQPFKKSISFTPRATPSNLLLEHTQSSGRQGSQSQSVWSNHHDNPQQPSPSHSHRTFIFSEPKLDRSTDQVKSQVASRHASPFSQPSHKDVADQSDFVQASAKERHGDEVSKHCHRNAAVTVDKDTQRQQGAYVVPRPTTPLLNSLPTDTLAKTQAPSCEGGTGTEGQTEYAIDLTSDPDDPLAVDYMEEDEFRNWLAKRHEEETERVLAADETSKSTSNGPKSQFRPVRNLSIAPPFKRLDSYMYNEIKINPKANVELHDGDFLRIIDIIEDATMASTISLRGWLFRRARVMNGLLERKANELCWILHVDEDDDRDPVVQAMISIPITSVKRRRKIKLTNKAFPAYSFREDNSQDAEETILNERVLVCRFKYICSYVDAQARERYVWSEKAIHRLRADECDPTLAEVDHQLRHGWRGPTEKGESKADWLIEQLSSCKKHGRTDQCLHTQSSPDTDPGGVVGKRKGQALHELDYSPSVQAQRRQRIAAADLPRAAESRTKFNKPARVIDLADGDRMLQSTVSPATGLPSSDPIQNSILDILSQRLAREDSTETVDIDLRINTTTRVGMLQQRYEGRVTSTFVPSISPRPRDDFRGGPAETPNKRQKTRHGTFTRTTSQSSSPASSERTIGRSPSVALEDNCELLRHRVSAKSMCGLSKLELEHPSKSAPDTTFNASSQDLVTSKHRHDLDRRSPSGPISPTTIPTNEHPHTPVNTSTVQTLTIPSDNTSSTQPTSHRFDLEMRPSQSRPPLGPPSLLTPPMSRRRASTVKRKYTFGDCFCGGGGMSRGAVMAGLDVQWGFDFNQHACDTYSMNFPKANIHNQWAHEFSALKDDHKCDICHLSPPCQFFSDAHTVMGKDDDMNTASLFAIMELLKTAKPRIVTLEQTSGLLRRHELYFNAVIQIFTSLGFSIRWRLINCADYGLPQRRWRIFILASCPGEPLPPFPKPTHSAQPPETGLKPYRTINRAIARIPSSASNHSPATALSRSAPYDGNTLARCITTSGGGMIHPSGMRDFTHREFACLQGFPMEHTFGTTGVRKQIGNAVPPIVARAMLESVRKALTKEDGVSESEHSRGHRKQVAIELD